MAEVPGILLQGDFPMSSVKVKIWEGLRTYDPEVELETEKHWQQLKTEKPQLFDGAVWCLQRYALEGEGESQTLLLEMQESSFKYVVYTHLTPQGQLLPPARRSGATGLMALTWTQDGSYVFGRRSQHVGAFPGFYHCVPAGMVDVPDLKAMIQKELWEEIGADWSLVTDCRFHALMDTGHEQGHKYEFLLSLKLAMTSEQVYRQYLGATDRKEHQASETSKGDRLGFFRVRNPEEVPWSSS
ncbi:unnamed protein product [Durusdinium trenchii]|uniref:Nudix hydrolase domain-containing protein n=1 Tax=Durusdinium trenchii TaxID=1381693 RepID=A0ABP0R008_9DINO